MDSTFTLNDMPFFEISYYSLQLLFQCSRFKYSELLRMNGLVNILSNTLTYEMTTTFKFEYYDEHSFNRQFHDEMVAAKNFTSFHINLQSSLKNLHILKANLDILKFDFKVIGLTECGNRTIPQLDNAFPGYDLFYSPPLTSKGGVVVYVLKDTFSSVKLRSDLSINENDIESICLEISEGNQTYVCCTVYRHPKNNYNLFEEYLLKVINTLKRENVLFYLQGDINIDLLNPSAQMTERYLDCLLPNNIVPCITKPTRITQSSATLIDHVNIFRPLNQIAKFVDAGCLLLDISDHLPTFFILKGTSISQKVPQVRPKVRIFSQRNLTQFGNELSEVSWNDVYTSNDCDHAFNLFHNTFTLTLNKCFPLTTLSRKKYKDKNWLTDDISTKIKYKNILYRKHLKKPHDDELSKKLKSVRKDLSKDINLAKRTYYRNLLTSEKATIQSIWKVYGELIGKSPKKENKVEKLFANGSQYTSDIDITNTFNTFFSTIGEKLARQFETNEQYKDYLVGNFQNTMFIHPIDRGELISQIKLLDKKKACGIDDITPRLVTQFADQIIDPLLYVYNLSFEQGVFP